MISFTELTTHPLQVSERECKQLTLCLAQDSELAFEFSNLRLPFVQRYFMLKNTTQNVDETEMASNVERYVLDVVVSREHVPTQASLEKIYTAYFVTFKIYKLVLRVELRFQQRANPGNKRARLIL